MKKSRALIAQSVAHQLVNLNVTGSPPDSDKIISVFFLRRLNSEIISITALGLRHPHNVKKKWHYVDNAFRSASRSL